ncbi:MAG: glycosyltransferase family 4 protein, partial [Deltaproteobacteria bacterium]|nr:glycosyltransferase family 4 protein [Deltaproteobacteria bacterium]
ESPNVSVETARINPARTLSLGLYQQIILPLKLMVKGITQLYAPLPSIPVFFPGKKIITIHDCAYDRFAEYKSVLSRLYIKSMYVAGKYFCDAIITDSNFAKEELVSLYHIKPDKITVVYPGIPDLPPADGAFIDATKEGFGIKHGYFLYVGITRPRKNLPGLLKAFRLFVRGHSDIQLVLAGRVDTSFINIKKEIQTLGIEDHVVQTGFVSDRQKAALYSGSSGLVFPSYYEGFGIPVIEAQSLGVPVLTSNTSSLPEVAGEGALYVNPHDTDDIAKGMEKLLDGTLRDRLIEKGLKNAGRFSWKQSAVQLLKILKVHTAQ